MEVREMVDEYLDAKRQSLTSSTHKIYRRCLGTFVEWCEEKGHEVSDLRRPVIREFMNNLKDRKTPKGRAFSPGYIHMFGRCVRTMLIWSGKEEDFAEELPRRVGQNMEMPKLVDMGIEIFTPSERSALFRAAAEQPFQSLKARDKAILS